MRLTSILILCFLLLMSLNSGDGVSLLQSSSAKSAQSRYKEISSATPVQIAGHGSLLSLDENEKVDTAFGNHIQMTQADNLWEDVDPKSLTNAQSPQQGGPRSYRSVRLNRESLKAILRRAPKESPGSVDVSTTALNLPMPDGSFLRFKILDSPIMEEQLANRFPEIKTYRGQGIDDPTATARFDWTQFGFHAIILSTRGTVLIEPATVGDLSTYVVYFQEALREGTFSCGDDPMSQEVMPTTPGKTAGSRDPRPNVFSGANLLTYRLAVAATAEFTQTYGSGTVAGGLAAITTTMNAVNAIYEREVAIRMVLIPNEDSIIFTDTTTDGYTHDNVVTLISENQTKLDAVIGTANYDIGHVFDGRLANPGFFSFQGQASIASVCRSSVKARGVSITRSVQPSNIIAIYSTAHEIGHQFGASHTFNATSGACASQRSSITAYEPATGSTIMGYRFTCSPEDLMSSDTYFHGASLDQITAYTTTGSGNTCPTGSATGNNIPTIDAGADYTIPHGTPFILTASAADVDGDPLTYCWEEFDLGSPSPPNTDDGTRPIFRSFVPTTNPARTFPRMEDIIIGPSFGESLPTTTRTMNFRITVRDNRSNGGAANSDNMQLNVRADAGPFTVTQPTNVTTWNTTSSQTVTWNVAGTNLAPVSCANVKISLSLDGGTTFPIILLNSTPNDGSETVTVPGTPSGNSRVKVEAVGNVFFNISQAFAINGVTNSTPTISDFTPTTGGPGTMVTINGTNFISPSAVRFNGQDSSFTVNSTTQIVATVPAGATNGPITVVTSSGTATSASNFLTSASFVVNGRVADAGNNAIPDVTMSFRMNFQGTITTRSTTTDALGNYTSGDVGCQNNVLVTPSKVGFSFSPLAISFTSSNCLSGTDTANFTGTPAGPNTIQFNSSNFVVGEGTASATITVTRTGDTSGSATVAYQTTDTDNFTVGCGDVVANLGGAFARCDFATSLDTLTFAAGETSKTFPVPIINDGWAEGVETFTVVLTNPAGATLGGQTTATVTINDNETVDGPNPIFTTPFFVRQHYLDFLSREPEVGEPWSAVLNNCSDVNNNPACDRTTVSGAFFGSPEFQLKGYFAYRFYKLAFNRLPLYSEIVVDMRAVTGATPAEVFQKKAAFSNGFVQRGEFMNAYDSMTNPFYVSTLMGRYFLTQITTPDPAAPDGTNKVTLTNTDLVNRLNGVGGTLTRAQVLRAIADSDQVFQLEFNQAFVAMQYYGYLRRTPEPSGFNAWLTFLNANPGASRTMVNGFMNSDEYRLRFGPRN